MRRLKRLLASLLVLAVTMSTILTSMPLEAIAAAGSGKQTVTVTNSKELEKELNEKFTGSKTIVFKSTKKENITIAKGSYKKITLQINAPNAMVVNEAVFAGITVSDASKIVEKANGNKYTIKDKKLTFVTRKSAKKTTVTLNKTNAKLSMNLEGTMSKLTVSKKSTVGITGKGKLSKVVLSGEGAKLTSAIKSTVYVRAGSTITLKKGAAKSKVIFAEKAGKTKLTNKTGETIDFKYPDGTVVHLKNGRTRTIDTGSKQAQADTTQNAQDAANEQVAATETTSQPFAPVYPFMTTYVVKFVTNSGTKLADREYVKGTALGDLPTPNKLDSTFYGWFYDEGLTSQAATSDTVNKDITLYAKYEEIPELTYEENKTALVQNDVKENFSLGVCSDKTMTLGDVKNYITIENISNPDDKNPMEIIQSSGTSFKICFAPGSFDAGASYRVTLTSDDLYFEGMDKSAREYHFTTFAEEVLNVKYADGMSYLKTTEVSNITVNGEAVEDFSVALFSIKTDETASEAQEKTGTFQYEKSGQKFAVGDSVTLYEGVRPDLRTIDTPEEDCGNVAYVEITDYDADTHTYSFKQAKPEDVIFTPDMLPISKSADLDTTDGNILTVAKRTLDFTGDVYAYIGLDSQTTIDVGDFIVFYEGEFGITNNSKAAYAEITKVNEAGENYVLEYNNVDWEYVSAAMDVYASQKMDLGKEIDDKTVAKIESEVEKQASDSGFAEEAGMYLASLALATDQFTEITSDMDLTDYQVTLEDGTPLDPSEVQLMANNARVEVSKPKIKANLSKHLEEFEGVDGLRLTLEVKVTITIHASDSADVKIDLTGAFAQEVKINLGLNAKAEWKVWGIFPYIADYRINADVDLYEYTGISIRADITTGEAEEDDDNEDGESLADQVKELLEDFESADEEEGISISTSLTEKYKSMLENESDWVDILSYQIFKQEQTLPQVFPIVAISIEANFKIQVNANVSIGMDFYYKNAKRYNYTIHLFKKSIQNDVINLVEEQYEFDFYVMGALGVRAGIELGLKIGLFSTDLDSVGFTCEAGAYVKLWGYFYYKLEYTASKGRSQHYCGALYIQVGCYLEIGVEAQVLRGLFTKSATLYEKEWPLWSVGMKENILDFVMSEEDVPQVKLKQYIRETVLSDDIFNMKYLDLVEGDELTKVYDDRPAAKCFNIVFTSDKFSYDPQTNVVSVTPDADDVQLETDMIITWITAPLAFTSAPIQRKLHISWDNLRDGYVIVPFTNGGSYVPIINESYNASITKPSDPTRAGYVFQGWYKDEQLTESYVFPEVMGNEDTTIYAKWTEATDTPYQVRYYLQNIESDEYTLAKTIEGKGTTNSVVTPAPEVYEGFLTPTAQNLTILADGSAILNYYYDRVVRNVTFSPGEVEGDSEVYEYKYGAKVVAPVFAASGYLFKGWDKEVASTMGAYDVTYTAIWEKAKDTPYRIEYYVLNKDGIFELKETITGLEVTGREFTVESLRKDEEYVSDDVLFASVTVNGVDIAALGQNAVVSADGKTVIKVNYGTRQVEMTYKQNNGSEDIVDVYYVGQTVDWPQIYREGYIFKGWYTDEACTKPVADMIPVSKNMTFYAKWEEKASVEVTHYVMGTDGQYPEEPTRIELLDAAAGQQLEVSALVDENLTVADGIVFSHAACGEDSDVQSITAAPGKKEVAIYYKRESYTLTWNLDGGAATNDYSENGTYYYGAEIIAPVPVKRGYIYSWDVTPATAMPAMNVSYQAVWTECDKMVIRFIGYDNTEIARLEGYEGDIVDSTKIPECPQRAGYESCGWDTVIPDTFPAQNMDVKATYKAISYTVAYELNGGSFKNGEMPVASYNVESGTISLPSPIMTGYTFDGWYEDAAYSTAAVTTIPQGSIGDKSFYAKWRANTYTIVFNGSGAESANAPMADMVLAYGQKAALSACTYSKEGYRFVGWATTENGTRVVYKDSAEVESLSPQDGAVITLYAVFVEGYSILYQNLADALLGESAATFFSKGSSPIALSAPEKDRTGYTFDGWYTDAECTNSITTITPATMEYDVVVYAKWVPNAYSVTFDANLKDGATEQTEIFTYDCAAALPAISGMAGFVNPGYSFEGWSTEQNSQRVDFVDGQKVVNLAVSGNVRLYAVWKEINYTISYALGSGAASNPNATVRTINTPDLVLAVPEGIKAGYQFLGWYDEDLGSYVTTIQQGTTQNRMLTAKWAHGGTYSVVFAGNTEGSSTFRVVRSIPEDAVATNDIQHVYYRTENGTAIGGTAEAINFLHVGGPEVYAVFTASDGNGSYKEFTVTGESNTAVFKKGTTPYYASAVMSESASEKSYKVLVYDVVSTEGNCQGMPADVNYCIRQIGKSAAVVKASDYTMWRAYVDSNKQGKKIITDNGYGSNWKYAFNFNYAGLGNTFFSGVNELSVRYLLSTSSAIGYYLTASVSEDNDGYQNIRFVSGAGGQITYEFEIRPGKHYDGWDNNVRMPAPNGITQGSYTKNFHITSSSGGLSQVQDNASVSNSLFVKTPMSHGALNVQFDANGSGEDDWDIKNITEYVKLFPDTTAPRQIAAAPVAFGKYEGEAGETITLALVFDKLISSATIPADVQQLAANLQAQLGLPVEAVAVNWSQGTNVVNLEVRLSEEFGATVDFNDLLMNNTSLLDNVGINLQ